MKLPRLAGIAACVMFVFLWTGCGDTYRPVANPVTGPTPSPQNRTFALVLSERLQQVDPVSSAISCADGLPAPCQGAAAQIDVPGDVDLGDQVVGVLGSIDTSTTPPTARGAAVPTPHMDGLAREGTRFTQFCTASPICTRTWTWPSAKAA